ncbi:MAG: 23S rRNA (guanosine(2251)-2'-O)-methyltransferase RlmB [Treponema sp.]|nr:23S rRNA (guanosine(2251)-2'-O)-methyltransferase RlmB [Treponema sp.]
MSKIITGFHAIEEQVLSINDKNASPRLQLFYSKPGPRIKKILEAAKKAGITSTQVDDKKLNQLVENLPQALQDHRGIVLCMDGEKKEAANIVDLDAWIKQHSAINQDNQDNQAYQPLTVVVLDRVTDPHNVGAILRSCDQFGANLVIIPEHNSANDIAGNEVIARTSAGASAWVPVAIVNNLVRAIEKLKAAGFWIYGADAGGETCGRIDFAEKAVIIMGSEGTGIAQLLEKQCDSIVSIPTCGKIDSLNVSVAAGVLLYELYRRRSIN